MLAAVTALNSKIHRLAPVLKSQPPLADAVRIATDDPEVPVATAARRLGDVLYVFAVGMRDGSTTATFTVKEASDQASVEVLDEDRALPLGKGAFRDTFKPWEVHLYRIATRPDRQTRSVES